MTGSVSYAAGRRLARIGRPVARGDPSRPRGVAGRGGGVPPPPVRDDPARDGRPLQRHRRPGRAPTSVPRCRSGGPQHRRPDERGRWVAGRDGRSGRSRDHPGPRGVRRPDGPRRALAVAGAGRARCDPGPAQPHPARRLRRDRRSRRPRERALAGRRSDAGRGRRSPRGPPPTLGLAVGDRVTLAAGIGGTSTVPVEVVGIWSPHKDDPYWLGDPLELDGDRPGRRPDDAWPVRRGPRRPRPWRGARRPSSSSGAGCPTPTGLRVEDIGQLGRDVSALSDRIRARGRPARLHGHLGATGPARRRRAGDPGEPEHGDPAHHPVRGPGRLRGSPRRRHDRRPPPRRDRAPPLARRDTGHLAAISSSARPSCSRSRPCSSPR